MNANPVWFITGAGRGMGIDITRAALAAGHRVVATGRDADRVVAVVDGSGISTMSVEPGFFRTELLVEGASTIWPELQVEDYAERTAATIEAWKSMNGQQGGDPAKLAQALVTLSDSGQLPLRFIAGADAMGGVEQNLATIQGQIDANRDLSPSLSYDA